MEMSQAYTCLARCQEVTVLGNPLGVRNRPVSRLFRGFLLRRVSSTLAVSDQFGRISIPKNLSNAVLP